MKRWNAGHTRHRHYIWTGLLTSLACGLIIGGALSLKFPYLGLMVGMATWLFCMILYFSEPSA